MNVAVIADFYNALSNQPFCDRLKIKSKRSDFMRTLVELGQLGETQAKLATRYMVLLKKHERIGTVQWEPETN
jgi:hypothetical protein